MAAACLLHVVYAFLRIRAHMICGHCCIPLPWCTHGVQNRRQEAASAAVAMQHRCISSAVCTLSRNETRVDAPSMLIDVCEHLRSAVCSGAALSTPPCAVLHLPRVHAGIAATRIVWTGQ
jgi:hypothetical protein